MSSHSVAVRLALLGMLGSHILESERLCPGIVVKPSPRFDDLPQPLLKQMLSEVQQMDEAEVGHLFQSRRFTVLDIGELRPI